MFIDDIPGLFTAINARVSVEGGHTRTTIYHELARRSHLGII
jgi:hypothetical protein